MNNFWISALKKVNIKAASRCEGQQMQFSSNLRIEGSLHGTHMGTQFMMPAFGGKQVKYQIYDYCRSKENALSRQNLLLIYACASISEFPSDIGTKVSCNG